MSRLVIENATVVTAEALVPDSTVVCEGGKITACQADGEVAVRTDDEVVDARGAYLAPGLIDLHVHGTGEFLIDNGPDDLAEMCRALPRYGVSSFLPAVCPRPAGEDAEFLASLAKVRSAGAEILGFHLEGPFLTHTGALPPEAIGTADPARVRALIEAAGPHRAVFSISPDFEGIVELIRIMSAGGEVVFMTHTGADVEQTQAAIEAGARHATHFYDVFYPPAETDPGVRPCGAVEAILADPRVSVDFILDNEHVDPVAVRMALACKGPGGVCLITDANVGAGLPPGRYQFGHEEVEFAYPGGPARLTENSRYPGRLAGSGLTLDLAVRNAVKLLGVDVPQAIRMAGANPARVLALDDRKGRIAEGYDADMIMLDESLNVLQTWIGGEAQLREGQ